TLAMFSLPLAFTAPAVLIGLAALVALWILLRLVPPRPREIVFPPLRLLLDSPNQEETPARTPWWLTLLRLLLAALLIIALAGPVWRPSEPSVTTSGPLALIVDNGWASADHWDAMVATAEELIESAQNRSRSVALLATAEGAGQGFTPVTAADARDRLRALEPRPHPPDRSALAEGMTSLSGTVSEFVWLNDGVAGPDDSGFLQTLANAPDSVEVTRYTPRDLSAPAIVASENDAERLSVSIARPAAREGGTGFVAAIDERGRTIGTAPYTFDGGATQTVAGFDLPIELRNDIARLELTERGHAGAVFFLDERWRRRTVGLLSGSSFDLAQPLLSPLHYLSQALNPFADVRIPAATEIGTGARELIDQNVSVIMLADIGTLVGEGSQRLTDWVENGGLLVRFAGPRLAEGASGLLPVRLRTGERTLGGNLSWEEPQPIGQFSEGAPFQGIAIGDDVSVTRQVLAEPDADLPDKTWASLADGTPLVTADRMGRGWVVLFHVTADTTWSNLPLSGTFVEMLRKIVAFSNAASQAGTTTDGPAASLPPLKLLDGYGSIGGPTRDARPLQESALATLIPSAEHPPGLYGTEDGFRALNLFRSETSPTVLDAELISDRAVQRTYAAAEPLHLQKWLFLAALLLLFADTVVMIVFRGLPNLPSLGGKTAALALCAIVALSSQDAMAQEPSPETDTNPEFALSSALETRLAYVLTGNANLDQKARDGLFGLSIYISDRTALEPGPPIGVNIDEDELAFFPLIYWPVAADTAMPSDRGLARIDSFMKNGGTVIFDTGDQISGVSGSGSVTPEGQRLREILFKLDVPPLEPVPSDHVLTKAFYLLQDFPGRWTGSPLWVERLQAAERGDRPVRAGDGVSPIMITGNDLAGAWAVGADRSYLYPTVPDNRRQRELSFRVGVNIVMYTLTGNYKADQVHVPALLERLGQ
ncbi:MAG: DUF4159 domain-containing protein, partial [Pseudomonadota bacterium]